MVSRLAAWPMFVCGLYAFCADDARITSLARMDTGARQRQGAIRTRSFNETARGRMTRVAENSFTALRRAARSAAPGAAEAAGAAIAVLELIHDLEFDLLHRH